MRCHTVPEYYLKYFVIPGQSSLWVYDKKDLAVRSQLPKDTTVIRDYYLFLPDKEGKKDASIEQFFSHVEGNAKPIIDSWITSPSSILNSTETDFSKICMFVASLYTRSPKIVGATGEMHVAMGKAEVTEKKAIEDALKFTHRTMQRLMSMYWGIRYVKGEQFFVTSDVPTNIFVPHEGGTATLGGGLSLPNSEVTFPLSPKACLFISKKYIKKCERVDSIFVEETNRRTIYIAERFVISPYKSNRIERVVEEFASTYGKLRMDPEFLKQLFGC